MPGLSVHYLSRRETGNLQQVDLNFDEPVDVVRVGLGTDNRSLVAIVRLRHMPPPPEPAMVPGAKPSAPTPTPSEATPGKAMSPPVESMPSVPTEALSGDSDAMLALATRSEEHTSELQSLMR